MYNVNGDVVCAFLSVMAMPCACEDDGKGARACGREGETGNTRVDDGKAARNRTCDHMDASVREGNVKAVHARKGNSGPQCASVHVLERLLVYMDKFARRKYVSLRTLL